MEAQQVVPQRAVVLNQSFGDVVVVGAELVSPKFIDVLGKILDSYDGDPNVRMVMFRDDDIPHMFDSVFLGSLGSANLDPKAIAVNLNEHWRAAFKLAINEPERSLWAAYHQTLIQTIGHEMFHMAEFAGKGHTRLTLDDDEYMELHEEECEESSFKLMIQLAKTTDIEPAIWQQSTFFAKCVNEMMTAKAKAGEEEDGWFKEQMNMLDNMIMYHLPAVDGESKDQSYYSFKRYVRLMAPESDQDGWDTETVVQPQPQMATNTAEAAAPAPAPQEPVEYEVDDSDEYLYPDEIQATEDEVLEAYFDTESGGESRFIQGGQQQNVADAIRSVYNQPMVEQPPEDRQVSRVNHQPVENTNLVPIQGLDGPELEQIMRSVFQKCHQFIFQNCGYLATGDVNSRFEKAEAVNSLPVQLTDIEKQVCFAVDCQDDGGVMHQMTSTINGIFGWTNAAKTLPMFDLHFNYLGNHIIRRLVPQNPKKMNNGTYSPLAQRAWGGEQISHIFQGDPAIRAANKASGKSDWINKITSDKDGNNMAFDK